MVLSITIDTKYRHECFILKLKVEEKMGHNSLLKLTYKICVFSNGLPPYNLGSLKANEARINHKFYASSLIIIVAFAFVYSTYGRYFKMHMDFGTLIFDLFAYVALTLHNIITAIFCYAMGSEYMYQMLVPLTRDDGKTRAVNFNAFVLILEISCLLAIIGYDIYVMIDLFQDGAQYFVLKYVQYFIGFTQGAFIKALMGELTNCMLDIKNNLVEKVNGFMMLPSAEVHESEDDKGLFTLTGWTKSALKIRPELKDAAHIKILSQQFEEIHVCVNYFNAIFGWPFLFVIIAVTFDLLNLLNCCIRYTYEEKNVHFLILRIVTSMFFYVEEIWVISSLEGAGDAIRAFGNETYKQILVLCDSQGGVSEQYVLRELMALWYQIANNQPKFVAGFIGLSRRFVFNRLIGITSFIAVVIDINNFIHKYYRLYTVEDNN